MVPYTHARNLNLRADAHTHALTIYGILSSFINYPEAVLVLRSSMVSAVKAHINRTTDKEPMRHYNEDEITLALI